MFRSRCIVGALYTRQEEAEEEGKFMEILRRFAERFVVASSHLLPRRDSYTRQTKLNSREDTTKRSRKQIGSAYQFTN